MLMTESGLAKCPAIQNLTIIYIKSLWLRGPDKTYVE